MSSIEDFFKILSRIFAMLFDMIKYGPDFLLSQFLTSIVDIHINVEPLRTMVGRLWCYQIGMDIPLGSCWPYYIR